MSQRFSAIERRVVTWMVDNGMFLLRMSLAIIFIWFGALKIIGISPAADLVKRTIFFLPGEFFVPFLGMWEVAIGIGLFFHRAMRVTLLLLFLQMAGTIIPFFVLPDFCFTCFPYGLTLEGQYIVKNLTLISAAIVIGGTFYRQRHPQDESMLSGA